MSNFREMTLQRLRKTNFKLLKYEHILYHFEAHNLEIQLIPVDPKFGIDQSDARKLSE